MKVISASYRTDIPAFYGEWFMNCVREGYVRYHNPFGPQVVNVSLKPEDVHAIVFWSKNFGPFLKHLDELDERGLDFYFHYTINGQPRVFEERVPPVEQAVETLLRLSDRYSKKHVMWRYDPILFSNITDETWHLETFERLSCLLEGATERCYISFADLAYAKTARNMATLPSKVRVSDPEDHIKVELALKLAEIAGSRGMQVYTCAEDFAAVGPIQKGACVDKDVLDTLWPDKARKLKLSSNRGKCGCYDSRDIGAYDTCPHGCIYCYAVRNRPLALKRYREHDPTHDALIKRGRKEPPGPEQLSLFQK